MTKESIAFGNTTDESVAGEFHELTAVPPLTSLYLYISGVCNLACRHCWVAATEERGGVRTPYLPVEQAERAMEEAALLGLQDVKLTGGEPLLHPRFQDILRSTERRDLEVRIETNGVLLTEETAKFLGGLDTLTHISVSLDGPNAHVHEAMRRTPGCFEKTIRGIGNIVQCGIRPQVICTLFKGNASCIEDMVALANECGVDSLKLNMLLQMGRGKDLFENEGLSVPEMLDVYRRVEDLMAQSDIPIYIDIPFAFRPIRQLVNGVLARCAVHNTLAVLPGGELSLCGIGFTIPELIYGRIGEAPIENVWKHAAGLCRLREQLPDQLEGICGQCIHRGFCKATCVAANYQANGRLTAPYAFCEEAERLGLFPQSRKRKQGG